MQCDEVIKELATPTDHRDSTALAGHIAGCPACAGWANRAVQLDRLWEATRPPEPTPEVWDAVWARMATSLDPSTSTEVGLSFTTRTAASTNGSPAVAKLPPKGPRSLASISIPPLALGGDRSCRPGSSRRHSPRRGIGLASIRTIPTTSDCQKYRFDVFPLELGVGGSHPHPRGGLSCCDRGGSLGCHP